MADTEEGAKKFKYTPKYLLKEMETEGKAGATVAKSVSQIVLGVGAGCVISAIVNKWIGFGAGAVLVGYGNYKDNGWAATLGTGMMASSMMMIATGNSSGKEANHKFDLKEEAGKAKERLHDLKESFMSVTYLDKIFKGKTAENKNNKASQQREIKSGAEEQPEEINGLNDAPADAILERTMQQLISDAVDHQKKIQSEKQVKGIDPDLMGLEKEVDFSTM